VADEFYEYIEKNSEGSQNPIDNKGNALTRLRENIAKLNNSNNSGQTPTSKSKYKFHNEYVSALIEMVDEIRGKRRKSSIHTISQANNSPHCKK